MKPFPSRIFVSISLRSILRTPPLSISIKSRLIPAPAKPQRVDGAHRRDLTASSSPSTIAADGGNKSMKALLKTAAAAALLALAVPAHAASLRVGKPAPNFDL